MRLFAIASDIPYPHHGGTGAEAANIVLHALLTELQELGHQIILQLIFNRFRTSGPISESEKEQLRQFEANGATLLPPILPDQYVNSPNGAPSSQRLGRLRRLLTGRVLFEEFYPVLSVRETVRRAIAESDPDVVLPIWSPEGVAATFGLRDRPKVVFHGDIDFVPDQVRLGAHSLFYEREEGRSGGSLKSILAALRNRLLIAEFKRAHLRMMREVDVIGNVTASNAEFYRKQGHPRAVYIRNMWTDPGPELVRTDLANRRRASVDRKIKIVGHVGNLGRTGSTNGLRSLLVDLIPTLSEVMGDLDYEVHVIGAGEPVPRLRPFLDQERVVVRGFVDDLDSELRSSDMVLILNNAGAYQAAFTRHLVAWAMGLCLIVHANSTRAIPEIQHMKNALVGATPAEVANAVRLAATDPGLNERVRRGGRSTYERYFTPHAVAQELNNEILRAAAS